MKQIPRKSKENTRDYIYRTLKQSIIEFYYLPGEQLSEPSISQELSVSRTPVREALILLENEGLVEVRPKQGTFVSKLSIKEIHNFVFLRQTIEKQVFKNACQIVTDSQLNELDEQLGAQKVFYQIKDGRIAMYLLDNLYHRMIYEIAGKAAAWKSLQHIAGSFNRLRSMEVLDESYDNRRYLEHKEILEIFKNKDIIKIDDFVDRHLNAIDTTLPIFLEKHPSYFTD